MAIFKFLFYSILGILAFLAPFKIGEESSILMGHIKSIIIDGYIEEIRVLVVIVSCVTILGTILGFIKRDFKNKYFQEFFVCGPINGTARILGAIFFLMVHYGVGPSIILDPNTGGMMANDLLPSLMVTFCVGVLLMPLLTAFGLVEFIGVLIAPFMRKVFKVPGYAAIDAIASFLGDGTIGIVVTDEQYQKGYYTQREAVIIATSFSIVGISFAAVVSDLLRLSDRFIIFYATIAFSTVIAGIIIARLPLKKFKDEYYLGKDFRGEEASTSVLVAVKKATETAQKANEIKILLDSIKKVGILYITFIPVIMFMGTLGLVIAEHTTIFNIISMPLVPILKLLGFSEKVAEVMAPSMIVGFSDMYLPSLLIESVPSEMARFLIGTLSFAQLIFLSETGMILVASKIGFDFWDTLKFFILRTIISFPVIFIITQILFRMGILAN
ncbi:YjiH family protein [Fusobacterium perfoetens]|uniref:YjiH family protein n=1 Tax=Fusobacterium perfoetens TaxID=852 RepID=UPI000484BD08|nr:YjiH family protein [Fusobacterium perfoetens]MCI6153012.1 YjiH family protein [Fusobacterium perfoetens]MDY3237409.1 YjiH family protein [Fusobacterium perfoetens]